MRALFIIGVVDGWLLSVVLGYMVNNYHHHNPGGYVAACMAVAVLCAPLILAIVALFAVDLSRLLDKLCGGS